MTFANKLGTLAFAFWLLCHAVVAQRKGSYNAVYSGVPWFDDRGNIVSAHGANIMRDNGRYYLYGEAHSDTSNAFVGFNCYSSADLYNWKFDGIALPVQQSGRLGPNRVGERPKVMRCPKTGEYIMLMHTDSLGYGDPCVGYATASTVVGPYVFKGPLLFNGKPIKKWDMGAFQDADGAGYLLIHGGTIYKLSDDYKRITEQLVKDFWPDCEAPAVFKKDNTYYWLASNRTSWDSNDNSYYTAPSLAGPWTARGNFAPKGTLTWDSQTTFVLPIRGSAGTTYLFMGDRWSFPRQASSATYVWQPMVVSDGVIALPRYHEVWQINTSTGVVTENTSTTTAINNSDKKRISYSGDWRSVMVSDSLSVMSSDTKGASFSVKFAGTQIGIYDFVEPKNGYAKVVVYDVKGVVVLKSTINMYSRSSTSTLKFITPVLIRGNYTLKVWVMGEHASWSDKRHPILGSTGNLVSLDKIIIAE